MGRKEEGEAREGGNRGRGVRRSNRRNLFSPHEKESR
jgi:hypothetical protein